MIKTSVATNAKIQKPKCRIEITLMVYTSIMSFLAVNFLIWVGGERVTTIWGTSLHHNAVVSVTKQRVFNWY